MQLKEVTLHSRPDLKILFARSLRRKIYWTFKSTVYLCVH